MVRRHAGPVAPDLVLNLLGNDAPSRREDWRLAWLANQRSMTIPPDEPADAGAGLLRSETNW